MRKYGFKIFSTILKTAPSLLKECVAFADVQKDIFMELMTVSESCESDLLNIKRQIGNIEFRIHVPHNIMGFDAGNKNLEKQNMIIMDLAKMAADIFQSKTIIVHAGCGRGDAYINETVRQFKLFNDERIIVENLPLWAFNMEPLHGNTPQEIKYIMDETGCGFCFDFSHAICAANDHLCDGDIATAQDTHMHFGTGNYPVKHFLNDLTDENAYIVMETGKGIRQHGDAWFKDYEYIKSLVV